MHRRRGGPRDVWQPREVDSAYDWKQYYAAERARSGRAGMLGLLDAAPLLDVRPAAAIVVPHTRFEVTGAQIASAVVTVLASGAERVLALGVLHGARRSDGARVAAARAGDPASRAALRGVHTEDGLAAEEFSLDGFVDLVGLAADRAGRRIDVVRRYPFLVGDDPATLPGLDELERLVAGGALLVATTDPIHHGHAYGTPSADCLDAADPATVPIARTMIDAQLAALSHHRFADFAALAERHRSDFRDTGPVVAHLVGHEFVPMVHDLALVDYADVLEAPAPSWVAGALITMCPRGWEPDAGG
jgi:hypothetical protein